MATEGTRALFKGLGPNIVGVAPSRAIYFCAYSQSKSFLNSLGWVANLFVISPYAFLGKDGFGIFSYKEFSYIRISIKNHKNSNKILL